MARLVDKAEAGAKIKSQQSAVCEHMSSEDKTQVCARKHVWRERGNLQATRREKFQCSIFNCDFAHTKHDLLFEHLTLQLM